MQHKHGRYTYQNKRINRTKGESTNRRYKIKWKITANTKKKRELLQKWSEYVKKIFHGVKEKPMLENTEESEIQKDGVKWEMEKMNENKATGHDGIVSESLSDDFGIDKVTDEIYNSGTILASTRSQMKYTTMARYWKTSLIYLR